MNAIGKRNPTSILLEADKKKLLFDCGFGALSRMAEKDIDFMKLDAIFITHTHTDHVTDLLPILHTMAVRSLFNPEVARKEPINVFGPKQLPKLYRELRRFQWPDKLEQFEIKIKSFAGKKEKISNILIESTPVPHAVGYLDQALAYKISIGGKSVVFSGDMDWSDKIPKFVEFAKDANLLIIDAVKPINWGKGVHLEPFQVSQIAYQANPKTLVISHLTDLNSPAEIKDAVSEFYKGEVIVARDGMKLEV